jgi:hypothetical protein
VIVIKVYDLSFRLLNNDTVEVKSDKRGWDWEKRSAREFGFSDSHLGAIRHLITNMRGLFPTEPPVISKAEELKPEERIRATEAV